MEHFLQTSFPSHLSFYGQKLPITWITTELSLSHSTNQPYSVSGFHSVTPLWQWILQAEYTECKTFSVSFVPCLLAITFNFFISISTVSHFYFLWFSWMSFIWAMWFAIHDLQDLLPKIHCSNISITLLFSYLSVKAITLQNLLKSFFFPRNCFVHMCH